MASFCVIGKHGFIGSALAKKLGNVSSYPTPETQTIFYLGGATHMDFEKNPDYWMNKDIQDFMFLLPYCKKHHIRFVYASSAMVYEKDNDFSKHKRALELIARTYPYSLGLRIFPVYGEGENRTVISKWCKEMKQGKQPVIYGDGTQKRDFIHVDDVVDQILLLEEMKASDIADVGAGNPISFNEIVALINQELGTSIEPIYKDKPKDYSDGIYCKIPLPTKVDIKNGLQRILGI